MALTHEDRVRCGVVGGRIVHERAQAALAALVEDLEWMLGTGESPVMAAHRAGSTPGALARKLHRAGRHDLAVHFDRAVEEQPLSTAGVPQGRLVHDGFRSLSSRWVREVSAA